MPSQARIYHVSRPDRPDHVVSSECVFPECEASPTREWDLPLCDRHIIKVYRIVSHATGDLIRGFCTTHPDDESIPEDYYGPRALDLRAKAKPVKSPQGVVYYLRFADRIKIGFTTNLAERLRALPHDAVLATKPGTMKDEHAEHKRFAHLCIKGEWFRPDPKLIQYIDHLRAVQDLRDQYAAEREAATQQG